MKVDAVFLVTLHRPAPLAWLASACYSDTNPSSDEESHPHVSEGIASANNSANKIGLPPPRERGDDLFVLSGRTIRVSSHPRHRLSFRQSPSGDEESHPLAS
jgi:hypothetical protein